MKLYSWNDMLMIHQNYIDEVMKTTGWKKGEGLRAHWEGYKMLVQKDEAIAFQLLEENNRLKAELARLQSR